MHEKVYVCLKVGTKYSAEYVNNLYGMVKKADKTYTGPFFCYTEDSFGIDKNITIIPILDPYAYEKWWFKIPLLVEPALKIYAKKIFFDLDIIIHGDLDFIDVIPAQKLTICKAYWKNDVLLTDSKELNTLYNSSVMIWRNADYIYNKFIKQEDMYMVKYKGVDRFLHHENLPVDVLPRGIVYSYRKGADLIDTEPYKYRSAYKIALFHQFPKQQDLIDHTIVKEFWK